MCATNRCPQVALPASLLNYVQRTGESVILDDAAAHSPFAEDPHIRRRQTRSVLCLPLLNQAKLVGVLYLENNLAPRVFAPSRIAVLKLLASQAATALENARLYRNLEEGERKTRRLIDANIIGISTWDLDGRILDANEAFLRMIDYSREDVVSGLLRWTDLTAPEWRDLTFRMQSVAQKNWKLPTIRKGILPKGRQPCACARWLGSLRRTTRPGRILRA